MFAHRACIVWAVAAIAACSGPESSTTDDDATASGGPACVPGQQVECPCPGGGAGVQACRDDGAGYDACLGCEGESESAGSTTDSSTSGATTTTSTTSVTSSSSDTTEATTTTGTTADTADTTDTTGPALPCPGGPDEIDLHLATLYDNPPGLADWPVTTTLSEVSFTTDGVHVNFSKIDGPDRWPDVIPPRWDGPLQYTLGMAECIDGQWHASAAIQYWYGLWASGGNVAEADQIAVNWYYDPGRWGALAGRQPALGETIGIFVVAGNTRAVHEDTPLQSPVMERSNVVLVKMPGIDGATYNF